MTHALLTRICIHQCLRHWCCMPHDLRQVASTRVLVRLHPGQGGGSHKQCAHRSLVSDCQREQHRRCTPPPSIFSGRGRCRRNSGLSLQRQGCHHAVGPWRRMQQTPVPRLHSIGDRIRDDAGGSSVLNAATADVSAKPPSAAIRQTCATNGLPSQHSWTRGAQTALKPKADCASSSTAC